MKTLKEKNITVIVCTYNRSEFLRKCLKSLCEQTLDSRFFSVIVIDNNSKDGTKGTVADFLSNGNFKYFKEDKQGLSHARNRGIKESDSEYICFIDDDAIADKYWLEVACEVIIHKNPEIFGGPIYPYYGEGRPKWFLDKYEIRARSNSAGFLNSDKMLFGSNIFFKKEIFDKIGFFDVELGMKGNVISLGEETKLQVIANQSGIKRWYEPRLMVKHFTGFEKMTLKYVMKRNFWISYYSRRIYNEDDIGFARDLYFYIRELLKFLFLLFLLPIRDKEKYLFWQNYFIEKLLPNFIRIGKLYSYFKR